MFLINLKIQITSSQIRRLAKSLFCSLRHAEICGASPLVVKTKKLGIDLIKNHQITSLQASAMADHQGSSHIRDSNRNRKNFFSRLPEPQLLNHIKSRVWISDSMQHLHKRGRGVVAQVDKLHSPPSQILKLILIFQQWPTSELKQLRRRCNILHF